ncbi:MAG: glycosyltransferase, partial [Bacteroidales bacterium]|nr:glycosyltransferase [Bacteroidales bacterium]
RIHQKKGIEILIQAWKDISHKFPDWEIIVAGNGDNSYISTLNDKIKEAELTHSMKIIPPVFGEDKYKLYSESAIFILPSYSENFGMVIAEAMSCGVPVITTKGTPWEILNKEDMGWWIDLSVENISLTLERAILTGMNNLYNKGQLSSLYIRNNYQYEQVSMKNEELYNWILGKTKKPDFVV